MNISNKNFNIVIPCYNEEMTIAKVLKIFLTIGVNKIIVVDDGSTDKSREIINKFPVILLINKRNKGYGYSLLKGLHYSYSRTKASYTIIADADNQHRKNDLVKLINKAIETRPGIVYGVRNQNNNTPVSKRITNFLARIAVFILYGQFFKDPFCGLKIFRNDLIPQLQLNDRYECGAQFAMFIHKHRKISEPVVIKARYSKYSMKKGQSLLSGFKVFFKLVLTRLKKTKQYEQTNLSHNS